jgi:hypothetical protein
MERSGQSQQSPFKVTSDSKDSPTLAGGFHSRGVPGEEGVQRHRMHVLMIGDKSQVGNSSQRVDNSQPAKGATGAEQSSSVQLEEETPVATFTADTGQNINRSDIPTDNHLPRLFVITKLGSNQLDTLVFQAGESGHDEAVALFTEQQLAQQYIEQAGWGESEQISEVSPDIALEWLQQSHREGIQYVTVNCKRKCHLAGDPQPVLLLDSINEESTDSFMQELMFVARASIIPN